MGSKGWKAETRKCFFVLPFLHVPLSLTSATSEQHLNHDLLVFARRKFTTSHLLPESLNPFGS